MAHDRIRHGYFHCQKLIQFWPVVGILGLRQVGKTTFIRNQLDIANFCTLDEEDVLEDAMNSAKVFLSKRATPLAIDEVQKSPNLFDAIKARVDKKRIPGQFVLSGSSQFSSKLGIRESLTGRMGMLQLHPLSLSEMHRQKFIGYKSAFEPKSLRFTVAQGVEHMVRGGVPVPAFSRDANQRQIYWQSWIETTIYRDLARVYGRNYRPEDAFRILKEIGRALNDGELPTLNHLSFPSRKARRYLEAMELIFLMWRLNPYPGSVAKEAWLFEDSAIARYFMNTDQGEGPTLSLARHFVLNELRCGFEYRGVREPLTYYKSSRGTPIDLIWGKTGLKIGASVSQQGWQSRPLEAAKEKLGLKHIALVLPLDSIAYNKHDVAQLAWTTWS